MRSVMTKEVLQFNKTTPTPTSLYFSSIPNKTSYTLGQTLDLTGLKVAAHYSNGKIKDVTPNITVSPLNGTTLSQVGTKDIVISYTENNVTITTYFSIKISSVSWARGSDEEITAMVNAADNGLINLRNFWKINDERRVTLTGLSDQSPSTQTVTFILMDYGSTKTYVNPTPSGKTYCSYLVGQKEVLGYGMRMDTNYKDSTIRKYLNSTYYNAIPSTLRSIFKKHINYTKTYVTSQYELYTTEDYFCIPASTEIFGNGSTLESGKIKQFSYYTTEGYRYKYSATTNKAVDEYWTRDYETGHYRIARTIRNSDGSYYITPNGVSGSPSETFGVSPFGVI